MPSQSMQNTTCKVTAYYSSVYNGDTTVPQKSEKNKNIQMGCFLALYLFQKQLYIRTMVLMLSF